ncbi:hypothetical protein Q9L58_000345 [Maublancomyces gigas]|uniref:Uncharacterized protein n=1 Tax=Discina gigas TaxID=1032678 RepID=A0ABR3GXT5_9PEZI
MALLVRGEEAGRNLVENETIYGTPWQGEGSLKDERVAVITAVEKKIDDAIIERREPRVTPQRRWPDVQPFAYWIKGTHTFVPIPTINPASTQVQLPNISLTLSYFGSNRGANADAPNALNPMPAITGTLLRVGAEKELAMIEEAPNIRPLLRSRVVVAWPNIKAPMEASTGVNIFLAYVAGDITVDGK